MTSGENESPCGGTGNYQNIGDAVAWLRAVDPRRVLDVGCGFGRWGFLCREFLEVWNGRVYRKDWQVRLIGVDACPTNLKDHHRIFYDEVHGTEIQTFLAGRPDTFDLAIMGDVLEHLPKLEGVGVLQECLRRSAYALVVIPIGHDWPQEALYGNEHEKHVAVWVEDDILRLNPVVSCRYRDYLGRPYLGAVLSLGDPKRLRGKLEAVTPSISSRAIQLRSEAADDTAAAPLATPAVESSSAQGGTRLHVALITMEYPPLFGGGIATYALHTARLLGEAGHRVSVFTLPGLGSPPELPNVTVHHLPPLEASKADAWELNWLMENLRHGEALSLLVADVHAAEPIDVIEVTDYYHEGLFLDTSSLSGPDGAPVPVVTQFHGPRTLVGGLNGATYPALLNAAEDLALADCEYAKTYSPMMRDQVNALWPGANCTFVPAAFWPAIPADGSDDALEYDFFYFGRLERRKGIEPFVRAIQEVVRAATSPEREARGSIPSCCFVGKDTATAPGGGSMAEWVERELRPVLGARLHLREQVPQADLWPILERARVIVLPSLWESLGFAALEAFCSGRPVICSDQVAATYVLEGEAARKSLVDIKDVQEFAKALQSALTASDDELKRWSAEMREAVERACRSEDILRSTVAYYRACVASARTGARTGLRRHAQRWRTLLEQAASLAAGEPGSASLKTVIESQGEYIARLEQERDHYLNEAQELGRIWAAQRAFIQEQEQVITALRQQAQ